MMDEVPRITLETRTAIVDWENEHGITLPASLREWFAIENSTELLTEYSNSDRPISLGELRFERFCRAFLDYKNKMGVVPEGFAEDFPNAEPCSPKIGDG
jgi:hypothetical protein